MLKALKVKAGESLLDNIKSISIAALLVIMVCLCAIYLFTFQGTEEGYDYLDAAELAAIKNEKVENREYKLTEYIYPEFIGLNYTSINNYIGAVGISDKSEIMSSLYNEALPYLDMLYSAQSACTELDAAHAAPIWERARSGNYIYIKYSSDLPIAALALAGSSAEVFPSPIYINEIFVLPSSIKEVTTVKDSSGKEEIVIQYTFYGLARGSGGNYYSLTVPQNDIECITFNTALYSAYNKSNGMKAYNFAASFEDYDKYELSDCISDTTPVFESERSKRKVIVQNLILTVEDDIGTVKSLTELFGFNTDKTTPYEDMDGSLIYYEEKKQITLSPDGGFEYIVFGEDAGISVSEILGASAGEDATSLESCLKAAAEFCEMLRRNNAGYLGSDVEIRIGGVYYNRGTVTIEMNIAVDNTLLTDVNGEPIITLNISGGRIVSFYTRMLGITATEQVTQVHSPLWEAEMFASEGKSGKIRLVYMYSALPETVTVKWLAEVSAS